MSHTYVSGLLRRYRGEPLGVFCSLVRPLSLHVLLGLQERYRCVLGMCEMKVSASTLKLLNSSVRPRS